MVPDVASKRYACLDLYLQLTDTFHMAAFRGTCGRDGCDKQRYSGHLCQMHHREGGLAAPSIHPTCATEGCPRRARGRKQGALCARCRRDAGDVRVMCMAEGCVNLREQQGLCAGCRAGNAPRLTPRNMAVKPAHCDIDGCDLASSKHDRLCGKHRVNRNACLRRGCAKPIVEDGRCDKHRAGDEGTCSVKRCPSPRFKAGLCFRHNRERNVTVCARPDCTTTTSGLYCRAHNVGIDFAAGDWHDWVAVEQLWTGRLNPARQPTVPELSEVFDRAERAELSWPALADRIKVDVRRVNNWRQMLGRIERQGAIAAARVAA